MIRYFCKLSLVLFSAITINLLLFTKTFAQPADVCLAAEKESNIQKRIDLFTDCIYEEFQTIKYQKEHNFHNLSIAYLGRAITYLDNKNYVKAKTDLDDAITLSPDNPELYKYRGLLLKNINHKDDAILDFSYALKRSKDKVDLLTLRGITYGETKKFRLAIADLTLASKIDETNYLLHSLLGRFLCESKNYKEAFINYETAVNLNKNDPTILNDYAFCLISASRIEFRDYRKAVRLAEEAVKSSPIKNSSFLDTLAGAYAGIGDFKNAVNIEEEALKNINPNEVEYFEEMKAALEKYRKEELYYE